MMKVVTGRQLYGQRMPWYWGEAWRRVETREVVLLVIPFNLLVGLLRQWWLRLREGPRNELEASIKKVIREELAPGWGVGYRDGKAEGEKAGRAVEVLPILDENGVQWGCAITYLIEKEEAP